MNSSSGQEYSGWRGEPSGRGTWSILSTCLITLTLCVWTAVHLNLQGNKSPGSSGKIDSLLYKPRWIVVGIFAPEIMVYIAWSQWLSARNFTEEMEKIRKKSGSMFRHNWTMTHSFFAIMGGFVVDHSLHSTERASLTGKAILHTAQTEISMLDISRSSIEDRSKSDGLGKMLVCIQAGYIILQILGRLKSGLAITLLEINTLGHVLCALVSYIFWFSKPLDVKDPMVLTPRWAQPVDSVWSMRNRTFALFRTRDRRDGQVKEREVFDHFRYETAERKRRWTQQPGNVKTNAMVGGNYRQEYLLCGHNKSNQQTIKYDNSTSQTNKLGPCRLCGPWNSPRDELSLRATQADLEETSILYCSICLKRKPPQHKGRRQKAADSSLETYSQWQSHSLLKYPESVSTINLVGEPSMDVHEMSALPGHNASRLSGSEALFDRVSTDTFRDQRLKVNIESPTPTTTPIYTYDAYSSAATLARLSPSIPLTPNQIPIIRRIPSQYEIGTWETTDLVLIWHDMENSVDDNVVRRELGDCPLWSGVSRIYCVDKGLRDVCYFKSAYAPFSSTLNNCVVVNTSATDRICCVQLDLPGIRRWKAVYEAACAAIFTNATFEEAALNGIGNDATPITVDGLNVSNANQYWTEDEDKNQFFRKEISNWPSGAGYLKPPRNWIAQVALAMVTACYGGLHVAAWNDSFPSRLEEILWRGSALAIAGACLLITLVLLLTAVFVWLDKNVSDYLLLPLAAIGVFLSVCLIGAYFLARFFLVLEAFISLRKLAFSAYDTPNWTALLPHL